MPIPNNNCRPPFMEGDDFHLSFKIFHELMAKRVSEILLVSSPYDAFIMEEDGRLAERIIHEYRGLNLTRPPRFTWVSSAREAFETLSKKKFDFVITMPRLDDMTPYLLGSEIRKKYDSLPVFLLAQATSQFFLDPDASNHPSIDKMFVWNGNTDLLLAIIKSVEDKMNVAVDTKSAQVRVIILVEDSPEHLSSVLPLLYRELVLQTQAIMEDSLNEEHRILRMRARPKILLAENYEEAEALYNQFRPYLLGVLSDIRFKRNGQIDDNAGFALLEMIRKKSAGLPLLVFSSEESNREKAIKTPAVFINKNSNSLHTDIRFFLVQHLAFGEFVFRLPNGKEVARASNLREMEKIIPDVPDESIAFHAKRNHFSTWLMARSEIQLASKLQPAKVDDFPNLYVVKKYLVSCIKERRKGRQKGIVTDFISDGFDPDIDFYKIGKGSLGGKARGLAFVSTLLKKNLEFKKKFPDVDITVPKTLVISTDGFDAFINDNNLKSLSNNGLSDDKIREVFLESHMPKWLCHDLEIYLEQMHYPLAIRSSSLLEDAQFQPFAGIYKTYMIPNNSPDISLRTMQLIRAIKLVYASTYLEAPRAFAKNTLHRTEEEKMAVIIQQIIGAPYGNHFYPAVSGVAQSYNFYPVSYMKPEDGIAHIALGMGKTVVEGGLALRFSPKYPQFLPQFSEVNDMLNNAQRVFFALDMVDFPDNLVALVKSSYDTTLTRLAIDDMENEINNHAPIRDLFSTYTPEDHRIRDTFSPKGRHVLSFANILKYRSFPLPEILVDILEMGRKGMGSPVEIEFAINIPSKDDKNIHSGKKEVAKPEFSVLQIRPMVLRRQNMDVNIDHKQVADAFCFSNSAMGNGVFPDISDIVFVNSDTFDTARTTEIAAQIGKINKTLVAKRRKYLLVGPGRWGSADRWLGIPVDWSDISGIGAIIETTTDKLKADPSQGTHFFHNITSLGISYITVKQNKNDFIDEKWLKTLPVCSKTTFVTHVKCANPLTIKIDGKTSCGIVLK